jgi:uracil-DNA glycosylase family 4
MGHSESDHLLMHTDAEHAELNSLISEAREQVTYFKELGVEGLEHTPSAAPIRPISTPEAARSTAMALPEAAPFSTSKSATRPLPKAASKQQITSPLSDSLFGDLAVPPPKLEKSTETFEEIWADIGDCTRCPLHQGRTHIVNTDGNRNARLMFVGEAPGADEDAQARPFVGRAGQLLTKIIEAIGLKREEVLIGNVNRCRPPGNRPPTPEEAEMCKPFLLREIAAVQPEVIVVLGNTAMKNLLDMKQGITKVRGQFQAYQGVKVMPTFHPAYLLRDPSKKKETWDDLKKVRDYLDSTRESES